MKKKRGFTLIELLAVIVILAIIALIATPLVLKYIDRAKEGANDTSAESILRASESYYMATKLNRDVEYPKTITFPDPNNEIGLKGRQPDSGTVQIYEDGSIYLSVVYDDILYTKYPNETQISKLNMVIGDYRVWGVEDNVIVRYNENAQEEEIMTNLMTYIDYYMIINDYVNGSNAIDKAKTLQENILLKEKEGTVSRSTLPVELNQELDRAIEIYKDVEPGSMTGQEFLNDAISRESELPYIIDLYPKSDSGEMMKTSKAYSLMKNSYGTKSTLIIPNYVKQEDGSLEKVTAIGEEVFTKYELSASGGLIIDCSLSSISINDTIPEIPKGKNVIISNGIEVIDNGAFYGCFLSDITLPNTIKSIGVNSFTFNQLNKLILPKSLKTLDKSAFYVAGIKGELVIPSNVVSIGDSALASLKSCGSLNLSDDKCIKINNQITGVTFENNSKIETIDEGAFRYNSITSVAIPGSIKSIGEYAFDCPTLTSATIERLEGSDLSVAGTAFGTITPIYQQKKD